MDLNIILESEQMHTEDKIIFDQFHKDSVFRVQLIRNKFELIMFVFTIFIGLILFFFSTAYLYLELNYRWAYSHLLLILYSILLSVIRILTIERSKKYFKNNFLNNFLFIWLILLISCLLTFPMGFLFSIFKTDDKSYFYRFFSDDNRFMSWIVFFGLLSIIIFPCLTNYILNKNIMKNLFYLTFFLIITLFVIICASTKMKNLLVFTD